MKKEFEIKEFEFVLIDAMKKFESKRKKYKDSWKECSLDILRNKLDEEYEEWGEVKYIKLKEYDELLDIINVALMLAERIKRGD